MELDTMQSAVLTSLVENGIRRLDKGEYSDARDITFMHTHFYSTARVTVYECNGTVVRLCRPGNAKPVIAISKM